MQNCFILTRSPSCWCWASNHHGLSSRIPVRRAPKLKKAGWKNDIWEQKKVRKVRCINVM